MSLPPVHRLALVLAAVVSVGCGPTRTPGPDECSPEASVAFIDEDRDGARDPGEPPLPGALVFFEDQVMARTDRCGTFWVERHADDGIVWVRGEDGLEPGPFWAPVPAETAPRLEVPVRRALAEGPLSFVVASDTHAGIDRMVPRDQLDGLVQAAAVRPAPHFIAVTGDLTQENHPQQFASIAAGIAAIDVPYVPVPGNHDWYDGGATYRAHFGPPSYAFDAGGVHFVVLNDAVATEERLAFLDLDRHYVEEDRPVVVLVHAPPRDDFLAGLEARGIALLFTGHLHANRVLVHDSFTEYNTQPLVMGGMDLSPAGFRVVRRTTDGRFEVDHRTIVTKPVLAFVEPGAGQVFAPCTAELVVAVEPGAAVGPLTATVEGLGEVPLEFAGGWTYRSPVLSSMCAPGRYQASVSLTTPDGRLARALADVEIGKPPGAPRAGEWPMLQGNAQHTGSREAAIGFPLRTQWVNTVGGHVHGGSPVVASGRVFVAVTDLGDGGQGGVVALELASGRTLWEHRVGFAVRNAPAVADGVVVFVSSDGTVHGIDAVTGEGRWTYELARHAPVVERSVYAAPTISDGIAYVGNRHEFIAIELATGELVWRIEPHDDAGELASHASAAVSGELLLMPFSRFDGMLAFDRGSGLEMWRTGAELVQAAHGSPVVDGPVGYVVNELTQLTALILREGRPLWRLTLEEGGFEWGVLSAGSPVLQGTTLLVGTQRGRLHAIDTASVRVRWNFDAEPSLIRATHYHGVIPAMTASPVVTGELVWVPGQDGFLRALDLGTGAERYALEFGVPMSSSPAVAGEMLVIASYDGSVRALRRWHPEQRPAP